MVFDMCAREGMHFDGRRPEGSFHWQDSVIQGSFSRPWPCAEKKVGVMGGFSGRPTLVIMHVFEICYAFSGVSRALRDPEHDVEVPECRR